MSKILDDLGLDYFLENVSKDGNCFYHAVSKQLNNAVPFVNLRKFVSDQLCDEDLALFNAINETDWSLSYLRKRVKHTGSDCLWADSVEINALIKCIPHLGLIIFDDECSVINKIQQNHEEKKFLFLLRKNYHYQSVLLSERNQKRVIQLMKNTENYMLKKRCPKYEIFLQSTIVIPLWIILFQFLNRSL